MRRPLALAGALLLLTTLVACTDRDAPAGPASTASGSAGELPPADQVLADATAELATLTTARFDIATEGSVDVLGVQSANGVITSAGDAEGEVRLDQGGAVTDLIFVVKDGTLHIKGLTGGWQQVPLTLAAAIYDPSAILTPDRGVANLARTATGTTEARETVNGVPAYRIRGELSGAALGALVPGVDQDVTGTLWIGVDRPLLHRVSFPVPGQDGTVTVTFSEFDEPVTVSAP